MKIKNKFFTRDWWTTQLSLIIRNEISLEERQRIPYTPAKLVFIFFILFLFIFILGFLAAGRFYRENVQKTDNTDLAYQLKIKVDSLSQKLETQNSYMDNIKKILGGDIKYMKSALSGVQEDSVLAKKNFDSLDIDFLGKADLKLREELEGNNKVFASLGGGQSLESLKDIFLFSPIKGIVSEKYNSLENHYGVDIVAEKDEPIKSIAEGTVILSSWTDDTGYVIAIQHKANLISVYKHCSSLMKKTGDFVTVGEIVAIIGNTGKLSSGPHLHFELWYRGNPVNPEELVSF
ncbi:MAG: M23 family metallopeptidase [Microscillaceae bacterium]|nr:M23 family metallopeptidase [Microscillaceae bacterium]